MFRNIFENIAVKGIVATSPMKYVSCQDYNGVFNEKYIKKNIKMTGVEGFYVSPRLQTASDLCYVAADRLLDDLEWSRDEIGALVFVTQFPDYQAPSTAFVLQHRLGIGTSCVAFDVNLGCSGYVVGLQVVASLLRGSNKRKALLLCGDTASKHIDPGDKSTAIMFGDAGSATALEIDEGSHMDCAQMAKGDGYRALCSPHTGFRYYCRHPNWKKEVNASEKFVGLSAPQMNGDEVFQFTITDVTQLFKDYFLSSSSSQDDYDYFVMHQAQQFILNSLADFCDIPQEKVLSSLKHFGNTSVASIPLTLCLHKEELQKKASIRLFLSGFGIGLSYGIVTLNLNTSALHDIIYTDDYYIDAE